MAAQFTENNEGWYAYLDPDDEDDFSILWSEWLEVRDLDVIGESSWIVPAGVDVTRQSFAGGHSTIWLARPLPGRRLLTNRIVTVQGRTADQSFTLITREQ